MTNDEKVKKLELMIIKKKKNRKIIRWSLLLICILLIILFSVLLDKTKQLIYSGEFVTYEVFEYNDGYFLGIVFSSLALIVVIMLIVLDFLFCRHGTVQSNGHYITVFKTFSKNIVYLNGEFNAKFYLISLKFLHKLKLPNDVVVTIVFLSFPFRLAQFSFDDGTPSLEL